MESITKVFLWFGVVFLVFAFGVVFKKEKTEEDRILEPIATSIRKHRFFIVILVMGIFFLNSGLMLLFQPKSIISSAILGVVVLLIGIFGGYFIREDRRITIAKRKKEKEHNKEIQSLFPR